MQSRRAGREPHPKICPLRWPNLFVAERGQPSPVPVPVPVPVQISDNRVRIDKGRATGPPAFGFHFHHFHHFTSNTRPEPTSRPARRDRLCHCLRPIRREPRIRIINKLPAHCPLSSPRWTPQTNRRRPSAASRRRRTSCRGCVATPEAPRRRSHHAACRIHACR